MAYRPISRPDVFGPSPSSDAPDSPDATRPGDLEPDLSLTELATALSEHGGGTLSADLALDLVLNEIVEHARLATGATAAAIALARGDEIVCRATTGDNAPDLGVRLDVQSGLSGACVQTRMWQRCDDSETDSRVDAEICRALGVRSILVFPVAKDDKLLGVFEIFSPRPSAFSDREIQTLEALSRRIISNVDRAADVASPTGLTASTVLAEETTQIAEPEGAAQPEVAQSDAAAVDTDASTTIPENFEIPPRDHWMTVLTLIVIAVAVFLGWMMGYVGKKRIGPASMVAAVSTGNEKPASKPPDSAAQSQATESTRPPDQPAPTLSKDATLQPESNGTGVVPAGSLVVYENGKVIFRTSPPTLRTSAKDSPNEPVMVPSKIADEYLVQRVEPEYPESAREQHIQGPVVLVALVGKDGAVEKLSDVKGDSQLAAAASDAVRQWRFKPFLHNGVAEEFQTQITVSFRLP
jgi:TonB family protein